MKRLTLFSAATIAAALLIGVTGCKHTANTIPIPGPEAPKPPPRTQPQPQPQDYNNLPPGNQVGNGDKPTITSIPNNQGGGGIPESAVGIKNRPHNEDRQLLAPDTIYFDFDSSTVKSSEESKIQDVANFLKSHPSDGLTIEGNCDERGTEKYNLSLGERRALAVREYLANLGVDPMRVYTTTYGAAKPVDPAHNEAAWKKNRRDDFVVLEPK